LPSTGKEADDFQGASGLLSRSPATSKFFVIKILTPKPLGLKILQSIFANSAPSKAFSGEGGGGTPRPAHFSQIETTKTASSRTNHSLYFEDLSTATRPQPRSGERMQPTAQAVERTRETKPAPKGRKNSCATASSDWIACCPRSWAMWELITAVARPYRAQCHRPTSRSLPDDRDGQVVEASRRKCVRPLL
jgi:hypothetical protein